LVSTIVAIATPTGEGGIGILRLSGVQAREIAASLLQLVSLEDFTMALSRRFYYGWAIDPVSGERLDEILAVWMKAPTTYTGEEVVEIHGHGGAVPLQRILAACLKQGAILANPGEFTQRAFLNGRLDLTQAEAVMDLIQARGEAAGRQAVLQLEGVLGARLRGLSDSILRLLAQLEAWIDFSDEIGDLDLSAFATRLLELSEDHAQLLRTASAGKILRQGLPTSIVGSPNVGKSSLLNALLGEERAIVSEYPGTTRDVLTEQISIEGITLSLSDTAGLRESSDPLELLGIARSERSLGEAELVLWVIDGSRPLEERERELCNLLTARSLIVVLNKSDLPLKLDVTEIRTLLPPETPVIATTLRQDQDPVGLPELRLALRQLVTGLTAHQEAALLTRERHVQAIRQGQQFILQAISALNQGLPADIISIDLRAAWTTLAELTGEAPSSAIVETIFKEFCIGK